MSSNLVFIHDDVLSDVADAIRFVEGSFAGIAPEDYADHIKALDKLILQPDVLNFYMPNGGTISLNKTGSPTVVELEYWLDENHRWLVWQPNDNGNRSITLNAGQRMYVRNTSETQTTFSISDSSYYYFAFSDTVEAHGNTNSLLCKNVDSVTSLSAYSYNSLFYNCTSLITAPELPANTVSFACYYHMFLGCTSLVTAPELPATTLADGCYRSMFDTCTSLVTAPELPATTLAVNSYRAMFIRCTSLIKISTHMIDISATSSIYRWLLNASAQGDFYCPAELTIPTGESGIPSGWTRHDI